MLTLSLPRSSDVSSAEQRRHPRAPIELQVRYCLPGSFSWLSGRSVNISAGGVFIAADNLPPIGTTVACELFLEQQTLLRGTGIVRWQQLESGRRGFGLQFAPLEKDAHERVMRLVESWLERNG